jgi:hypothetical protein
MLTHGAMRGCRLTSLVVCINDKFHDIRERNVTIRSEIWTTNIRSLRFWDIRECETLWGLVLRSLGCITHVRLLFTHSTLFLIPFLYRIEVLGERREKSASKYEPNLNGIRRIPTFSTFERHTNCCVWLFDGVNLRWHLVSRWWI